ncbi:DUF5590 domain-containing protein [Tetragenococcus muriaticus]|uniref:Uncharacterized protein n=2 Tax=Tetragenococcus muriaticus TaxID=64642 RepID=A0A091C0Q5_9ENTE|nr:DUF5590 domain-containing protein [Tetragenococcus muriaticus]KFN90534.1 hypothetical protein TMU3MR103_1447 [Tetragenococcus muriaticus 3MR10-3]KFN91010.1 hypothetical protein TMUPMC115_1629 [Tetragenococcus muriaticus PMC-11-5]
MPDNDKREKYKVTALFAISMVLLFIIFFSIIFYIRASRPMRQARQEAEEIAEEYANIDTVDDFYWFTREETYFTVMGRDEDDRALAVIVPQSGDRVTVEEQSEGLSEQEARQAVLQEHENETVEKASLGMVDDTPVWEVVTTDDNEDTVGSNYYLLQFQDGEEVKTLRDI